MHKYMLGKAVFTWITTVFIPNMSQTIVFMSSITANFSRQAWTVPSQNFKRSPLYYPPHPHVYGSKWVTVARGVLLITKGNHSAGRSHVGILLSFRVFQFRLNPCLDELQNGVRSGQAEAKRCTEVCNQRCRITMASFRILGFQYRLFEVCTCIIFISGLSVTRYNKNKLALLLKLGLYLGMGRKWVKKCYPHLRS